MTHPYATEHELVERALRGFRDELLQVPQRVQDKGGDLGPLTEMDELMDQRLYAMVSEAFPGDGWISEESPHEATTGRYWIIDPIDGTREFVSGIPEWAVSVGLWQEGRPLYGWLYNPPGDDLWHGGPGHGAFSDREPVNVIRSDNLEELVVGVSRTDLSKGRVPETDPPATGIGSIAYKLGLVGAGKIDATISVTPKNIWDVAGGIAIVLGAGGAVVRYDTGGDVVPVADVHRKIEGGFVAGHPDWVGAIRDLYRQASGAA